MQDGTHAELATENGSIYQKMVAEHQKSQAKEQAENRDQDEAKEQAAQENLKKLAQ